VSGDCRRCRDYRHCIVPPEWFNYAEVRFCVFQIIWILQHAETLRAGHWPKNPNQIGDDNLGQKGIKTEASFTKPIIILAEVECRLRRTGINGKLLVAQIEAGRQFSDLDRDARDALLYVKGWRQKRMSFRAWKKARKYYQKVMKEQKCADVSNAENLVIVVRDTATGTS
jgi:hypothetical protein